MEINFGNLPRFADSAFRLNQLIPEWAMAHHVPIPAIERQLYYAHAWINANPKKAPKSDIVRFLFNWMRKAKEMGSLAAQEPDRRYKEELPADEMTVEEMIAIRQANMGPRRLGV